ncbi:MAG: YwaF family protein [Clostridia bacterium]|nr:YwaF family protein [Clostridia bacterium]
MELFWKTTGTIEKGHGFSHFDTTHLLWLAAFLAFTVVSCMIYKKCSEKGRQIMRHIFASLLIADELFKVIGLVAYGNYNANYVPLHLCSINIILIAIHAIKPSKLLGQYLYTIGIPATLMALLFPTWTKLPVLNFMHIHSFTVHILLAVYPIMITYGGDVKPRVKDIPKCLALLIGMAIPVYFFNLVFDTNFMFLMEADKGNPLYIFEQLFGYHWIGFPILAAAVLVVMYVPLVTYRKIKGKQTSKI